MIADHRKAIIIAGQRRTNRPGFLQAPSLTAITGTHKTAAEILTAQHLVFNNKTDTSKEHNECIRPSIMAG